MFQRDCCFAPHWTYECDKCEFALAEDISIFNCSAYYEIADNGEQAVEVTELRKICAGEEEAEPYYSPIWYRVGAPVLDSGRSSDVEGTDHPVLDCFEHGGP